MEIPPGLVCSKCRGELARNSAGLACVQCGHEYRTNQHGFTEMLSDEFAGETAEIDTTTTEYADDQHVTGNRVVEDYLLPLLREQPLGTVLDVGCGVGAGVARLGAEGYDAYGIDFPSLSRFWAQERRDPRRLFCATGVQLPFASDFFDVVYSFGVIEHVGTVVGHCTLRPDFEAQRQRYADEIARVTKPGGRIIIACPNKSFPVDIQHGPGDEAGPAHPLRSLIFHRTGINLHKTSGRYHLVSYGELKALFRKTGGVREFEPLPLTNYFAFGRFKQGFLKPFGAVAEWYANHLPVMVRPTFLNPYMLMQMRK